MWPFKKEPVGETVRSAGFCDSCGGSFKISALKEVPRITIYSYFFDPTETKIAHEQYCVRCRSVDFKIEVEGYSGYLHDIRSFKVEAGKIEMVEKRGLKPVVPLKKKAKAKK